MSSQEYLNELIKNLKVYIDIRNKKMMGLDELFKQKGAKNEDDITLILKEGLLTESDIDVYYETAQLTADTNVICKKICDFLYFSEIVGNSVNTDELHSVTGFTQFIKEYVPYSTTFILTPENEIKEANLEQYKLNKKNFGKAISNKNILNFIDESRNGDIT